MGAYALVDGRAEGKQIGWYRSLDHQGRPVDSLTDAQSVAVVFVNIQIPWHYRRITHPWRHGIL